MDGYPDDAALVGEALDDGLPDPPRTVGRKTAAASVVEALDRLDEADVAFVDEVQQRQAAVLVVLRYRDDQAEIGGNHPVLDLDELLLDCFALGPIRLEGGALRAQILNFSRRSASRPRR